jgi:hypothetical protein
MPFNSIFAWVIKKRIHNLEYFKKNPFTTQDRVLLYLLKKGRNTYFGKSNGFHKIKSYSDFKEIPLTTYEELKPFIQEEIDGKKNILWPKKTIWFAKSSGTTSNRSKFIPVTKESLFDCHYKGGKDLLSIYYTIFPNRKLYNAKHLIIGGSAEINKIGKNSYLGDLSAIIVNNLPWWAEIRRTPSKKITLLADWENKLELMTDETVHENICIIAGVPSWTLVFCNKVLEKTGKKNLHEVWPNLELYMHGGVSFLPYEKEFQKIFPQKNMQYMETYNASEGFFGIQDDPYSNSLLLMLDYGIYYEFIPMENFEGINSKEVINLIEVKLNINYALVISTNGGLWRYILGDTIKFTSLHPFKFIITGRTSSFINCFGEELIVENTEKALANICLKYNCQVKEYTVGPFFMENKNTGRHDWVIEFVDTPESISDFAIDLDDEIRALNSDYDAKRSKNLVLEELKIHPVPSKTFERWFKENGKLGGQNKIPRLSNSRDLIEKILSYN